jgi:heptosyltransferase-1
VHVLLVKMSSLGDVVHALPAVSDATRAGFTFDWVVEESFAAIPARHPGVRNVIPIGWRRWRGNLLKNKSHLTGFFKGLRSRRYDQILDAQGLIKSGVVAALADGGLRSGFSRTSAREGLASVFVQRRIEVERNQHAIDRLRQLFAAALGYRLPDSAVNFGIGGTIDQTAKSNRCVLLHGTTWASKHWPEPMWCALAALLRKACWEVVLPWGNRAERERAQRIAAAAPGARVLDEMSVQGLLEVIDSSKLAVGVDSGLTHLAGALGVPTVVLYGSTSAALTGCRGDRVANLQSDFDCAPCLSRECRYRGQPQMWRDEAATPACYARLTPERVIKEVEQLLEQQS